MNAVVGINQGIPCVISKVGIPFTMPQASTTDSEVLDWKTRVIAQGETVSDAEFNAANTFMLGLKSNGLRTKAYRVGIYLGSALNAVKAPFIKDYGDSTDNLINFVSGDYTSNGLTGNGSNKVLWTGVNASTITNSGTSWSYGIYRRTLGNNNLFIGGGISGNGVDRACYIYAPNGSDMLAICWDQSSPTFYVTATGANTIGCFICTRVANNDLRLFKNGSQVGSTNTAVGSSNVNNANLGVHDAYLSPTGVWAPVSAQLCFYWFGAGLTSSEVSTLNTLIQNLQTTLGRQV